MMADPSADPVVTALSELVPGGVVRRRLVRPDGRRLSWVETTGTGPTVVLTAGSGEMALDWAPTLPPLAERFRVVAYDRAGLGASDRIPRLTLDSQIDDLLALMNTVGPAVLVGHSWGGLLVQLAAFAESKDIAGLVLVDPYHEDLEDDHVSLVLRAASSLMINGLVPLKIVGLFNRIAVKFGRELAERCTDVPRVRALVVDAYLASYATLGQVRTIRAEHRLVATSVDHLRAVRTASAPPDLPMRILTATRGKPSQQMQDHAEDLARDTSARFPRGQHVAVPDSGHYIHHDQPAAVVAAVTAVAAGAS